MEAIVAPFVSADVLGFLINTDAFVGGEHGLVNIVAEGVALYESEASRANAAGAAVESVPVIAAPVEGFWRQGSPADVVAAGLPANPSRCPFIAGNPAPAYVAQQNPATVVVGGPAERFGGEPSPAEVAVSPRAMGIRAPVVCAAGETRLPNVTVLGRFKPVAMGRESIVKNAVIVVIGAHGNGALVGGAAG